MKWSRACLIFLCLFLWMTGLYPQPGGDEITVSQSVYFVNMDGDDVEDGSNWANAKLTIADAISSSSARDTIIVKYGTYNISSYLNLPSDRKIISDDGDATGWDDAEPDSSLCIIDAGGSCRVFVFNGDSISTSTRIKGFKITNGNAGEAGGETVFNKGTESGNNGGGIYIIDYASPTIENCWIIANSASTEVDQTAKGGGIYIGGTDSVTIQNNRIENNTGSNSFTAYGGGIYVYNNSNIIIQRNMITDNNASTGSNDGTGGGIYIEITSSDIIRNNILNENSAGGSSGSGYGGGVYINYSEAGSGLINNTFYSNSNSTSIGKGVVSNGDGSGLYLNFNGESGQPTIENNIFLNHNVSDSDGKAIHTEGQNITVDYNCFYGNTTNYDVFQSPVAKTLGYTTSNNEVTSDPLCNNPASEDFRLKPGSPCIDAGNSSTTNVTAGDTDFRGDTRFFNTTIDIGAYEYNADDSSLPVCLSDFSGILQNGYILLTWLIESEIDNLGYTLLRAENDGQFLVRASYENDESLLGRGTSSETKAYTFIDKTIIPGLAYHYKLIDTDYDGKQTEHPSITVKVPEDENNTHPLTLNLFKNYPNPFNSTTQITFILEQKSDVFLDVFNIRGEHIESLINKKLEANTYTIPWTNSTLSSGVYIFKLQINGTSHFIKSLLIK